jgi:hypothetical protein
MRSPNAIASWRHESGSEMAKEKFTVIYNLQDYGAQASFTWKEKEIVTKEGEKNAGGPLAPSGTLINAQLQVGNVVTIEAESATEAAEAVRVFLTQGPSGASTGGSPIGTSGGFVDNKALAGKTSSLSEVNMIP